VLVARVEVLGEIDSRGGIRFTVDQESVVRGLDGAPVDVIVENFSRTGFLFVGDVDLPPGTLISIGLSGAGAREAKVIRRDGDAHGCEFLMPLPNREMANAFRGQEELVSSIEAALERRYREAEPAEAEAPVGIREAIRRLLGR
jgi:hypothetical protein